MKTLKDILEGSLSPPRFKENCKPVEKCEDTSQSCNPDKCGHIVVNTIEELHMIPCKIRQPGMTVTVIEEDYSDYRLQTAKTGFGICDNNSWVKISNGGEVPGNIEGDKNFIYDQKTPSKKWNIIHDLNKKPSVTVTDSADTVVEGRVIINDGVRLLIEFNAAFTGTAILN
ncbi:MAG: hypothetical protein KBS93_10935 [Flavobacteriaceae bacterium]|nr:hypothetical protein [Candidatus Onthonaster equi]